MTAPSTEGMTPLPIAGDSNRWIDRSRFAELRAAMQGFSVRPELLHLRSVFSDTCAALNELEGLRYAPKVQSSGEPSEKPRDLQSLCDRLNEMFNTDDTPDELSQEAVGAIEELWESRDNWMKWARHLQDCTDCHVDDNCAEGKDLKAAASPGEPSGDVMDALRGVVGLVQLLTARDDLRSERDAILSNHRMVTALAVLEKLNG